MQLLLDFAESVDFAAELGLALTTSPDPPLVSMDAVQAAALTAAATLGGAQVPGDDVVDLTDQVLDLINDVLDSEHSPEQRRSWLLLSMVTATARGLIADGVVTDPRGFRALNDEDFGDWIIRHRAHPGVVEFPLVRAMYDMVFGYTDGDPNRPVFGAGVAVFLTGQVLFDYKGAFFWKMTAGMGDVVIAPLYQALQQTRSRLRVLPSHRCASSRRESAGRRCDHDGQTGSTRRRHSSLRTVDTRRRSTRLSGEPHRRADRIRRR